jgi:hypothetical protein
MPDGDITKPIRTLGPVVGKVDQGVIRPRHMICIGAKPYGICLGCESRFVHDECLDCKNPCEVSGSRCVPVSEANQ